MPYGSYAIDMSHPFEKMFERALKSSSDENLVIKEAKKLLDRGYSQKEVCGVLLKLEKSLIDDTEAGIVRDAREEVCEAEDETDEE
jgi:SOS response regulatory protein OraA/RecX